MGLLSGGIGGLLGDPTGGIASSLLPDPGSGGGKGKDSKPAPTSVNGKPLTTAAQFALEQNGNRYQAPLYDPMADPKTSAFLAPYFMYNPGRINGKDYQNAGAPQLGTYDPLGEGYYLSELQTRAENAEKKAKKKRGFASFGATLGAVAGGVGGFITGGPAGAVAGASQGSALGQGLGNAVFDITAGDPVAGDLQAGLGGRNGQSLAGAGQLLSTFGLGGKPAATGSSLGGGMASTTTAGGVGAGLDIGGADALLKKPGITEQDLAIGAPAVAEQADIAGQGMERASRPTDTARDVELRSMGEQAFYNQNPSAAAATAKALNDPTWPLTQGGKLGPRDLDEESKKIDNMNDGAKRLINQAAQRDGHDSAVLTSLAIQESSLNPNALLKDKTGQAVGLMQLRAPAYSDVLGLGRNYKFKDSDVKVLLNPQDNVDIGSKYLSSQFTKYGAETTQEALAGYYGGPSMIEKYRNGDAPPDVSRYVNQVYSRALKIDERQRRKAISNDIASRIASSAGYTPYGDYNG